MVLTLRHPENLKSNNPVVLAKVLAVGSRYGIMDKGCVYYDAAHCTFGRQDKTLKTVLEDVGYQVHLCPDNGEKEVADKAMASTYPPPPSTVDYGLVSNSRLAF